MRMLSARTIDISQASSNLFKAYVVHISNSNSGRQRNGEVGFGANLDSRKKLLVFKYGDVIRGSWSFD